MITITKEQFEKAYIKFSPSPCESFYLKNLSISSLYLNPLTAVIITFGLITPFIFGLLVHILNWPIKYTYVPSFIYAGILAIIGISTFRIWRKRRKRITNICKELNFSKKDYEEMVKKYYYENYYPDIKDYIQSISTKDK